MRYTDDVWLADGSSSKSSTDLQTDSGLLVVIVEVNAEQEVFQVRLVAPVDQFSDH